MYEVVLTETFAATHHLPGVRPEVHDHTWVVRVTLKDSDLVPPGFVVNYYELVAIVKDVLPHGHDLNAVYPFVPTAENLAKAFYEALQSKLPQLNAVAVGEFPEFMCTYRPETD